MGGDSRVQTTLWLLLPPTSRDGSRGQGRGQCGIRAGVAGVGVGG